MRIAKVFFEDLKSKTNLKNFEKILNKKLMLIQKKKLIFFNKKFFSVLITSNKEMKKLNKKFRKRDRTTDVLSFPLKINDMGKTYLGDIAINYEIVEKRSKNKNFQIELDKMWIHGLLHLLGYTHEKLKSFKIMSSKEKKILQIFK